MPPRRRRSVLRQPESPLPSGIVQRLYGLMTEFMADNTLPAAVVAPPPAPPAPPAPPSAPPLPEAVFAFHPVNVVPPLPAHPAQELFDPKQRNMTEWRRDLPVSPIPFF